MTTVKEQIVNAAAAFRATVDEALQELVDAVLRAADAGLEVDVPVPAPAPAPAPAPELPHGSGLSAEDRAAALAALDRCEHIAVVAARFGLTQQQLTKLRSNRRDRDKARGRRRCLRSGCGREFVPANWRAEWYCSDQCRKGQTRDDDGCGE